MITRCTFNACVFLCHAVQISMVGISGSGPTSIHPVKHLPGLKGDYHPFPHTHEDIRKSRIHLEGSVKDLRVLGDILLGLDVATVQIGKTKTLAQIHA